MKKKGIYIELDKKKIGLVFLGVGLTMFILNMVTIISLLPYLSLITSSAGTNSLTGYYLSVISSIILIVYSVYNINIE